jgi:hypothetical protein
MMDARFRGHDSVMDGQIAGEKRKIPRAAGVTEA